MSQTTQPAIFRRADIYHDFYQGRGKNYEGEAKLALELIREQAPAAESLLDVACGSGAHLRELSRSFGRTVGVDLSHGMLEIAARIAPGAPLHQGDMRGFRLDERFDAVICMFSSIGFVTTVAELEQVVRNLADHTNPGGVVLVEPWWFPDNFIPGYVGADIVKVDGRSIARMSHTVRAGANSQMEEHFMVATAEAGVEHFSDTHVMSLFDREAYEAAFLKAGLDVEYVKHEVSGPGVFVGKKR